MKSKSKSEANQTQTQIDNRVAADGNAIVLGAGAKLEQLSDDVALAALDTAKDTASSAFDSSVDQLEKSLDFAGDSVDRSLSYGERIFAGANDTINKQLQIADSAGERNAALAQALASEAIGNVTKSANPDAANTQTLIKWGAVLAALAFIVPKLI